MGNAQDTLKNHGILGGVNTRPSKGKRKKSHDGADEPENVKEANDNVDDNVDDNDTLSGTENTEEGTVDGDKENVEGFDEIDLNDSDENVPDFVRDTDGMNKSPGYGDENSTTLPDSHSAAEIDEQDINLEDNGSHIYTDIAITNDKLINVDSKMDLSSQGSSISNVSSYSDDEDIYSKFDLSGEAMFDSNETEYNNLIDHASSVNTQIPGDQITCARNDLLTINGTDTTDNSTVYSSNDIDSVAQISLGSVNDDERDYANSDCTAVDVQNVRHHDVDKQKQTCSDGECSDVTHQAREDRDGLNTCITEGQHLYTDGENLKGSGSEEDCSSDILYGAIPFTEELEPSTNDVQFNNAENPANKDAILKSEDLNYHNSHLDVTSQLPTDTEHARFIMRKSQSIDDCKMRRSVYSYNNTNFARSLDYEDSETLPIRRGGNCHENHVGINTKQFEMTVNKDNQESDTTMRNGYKHDELNEALLLGIDSKPSNIEELNTNEDMETCQHHELSNVNNARYGTTLSVGNKCENDAVPAPAIIPCGAHVKSINEEHLTSLDDGRENNYDGIHNSEYNQVDNHINNIVGKHQRIRNRFTSDGDITNPRHESDSGVCSRDENIVESNDVDDHVTVVNVTGMHDTTMYMYNVHAVTVYNVKLPIYKS